jgi:hypothetical protein
MCQPLQHCTEPCTLPVYLCVAMLLAINEQHHSINWSVCVASTGRSVWHGQTLISHDAEAGLLKHCSYELGLQGVKELYFKYLSSLS